MQMMCAWESVLGILPPWLRQEVNRKGKEGLQELRLRLDKPPELDFGRTQLWLERVVREEDLLFCINTASRYSPWASETISQGYLTISGGHRLGICGETFRKDDKIAGIRHVRSINIRIARDFPGIGATSVPRQSLLILGAPGWGKTTLLRDIAREIARREKVAVVDERGELFPEGMEQGRRMDILTGCPKEAGIDMVLRTMGPEWIALDEITAASDTSAILQVRGCGVRLIATAHASSLEEFRNRPIYRPLLTYGVFHSFLVLGPDKTWRTERMAG